MNCCDEYGDCRQGRDCPIRKNMKTLREQFELDHFGISPGKIGQKHHAAQPYPPSHWRRAFKGWVLLALGWIGGTLFTAAVIILWKVWP